jgi:hypothetical protein
MEYKINFLTSADKPHQRQSRINKPADKRHAILYKNHQIAGILKSIKMVKPFAKCVKKAPEIKLKRS